MGVQAEPDWLGVEHRVGVERMGNAGAVPQSPVTGQRIPSPQLLSQGEIPFPGDFAKTLHETKNLPF